MKILDDDAGGNCHINTDDVHIYADSFTIKNFSRICQKRRSYNETLFVVSEKQLNYNIKSFIASQTSSSNLSHDTYAFDSPYRAGEYNSHIYRIIKGGLKGTYFNDLMLTNEEKTRIDSLVNFTWSEKMAQSVRWDGLLQRPDTVTDCCTFFVKAKNVRLWINRYLIINEWNLESDGEILLSGFYDFQSEGHTIIEIMLEVRDIDYASSVKLMWSGSDMDRDIISSDSLFWKVNATIVRFISSMFLTFSNIF